MLNTQRLLALRARAQAGLNEVLDFFASTAKDPDGGFYGKVGRDLRPVPDAERSLVLNARLLWTYAAAYRLLGRPQDLDTALHALTYIQNHFLDRCYGGGYWMLNADGTPADTRKYVYGQCFLIYGGAELMRAAGRTQGLQLAQDIYRLLEEHAQDKAYGGYYETYDRQWNRLPISFNIPSPEAGSKALNTHLHLIEAYTNLLRVWEDKALRGKVEKLIDIMSFKLLDRAHGHYKPYMSDDWSTDKSLFSFGHDIEGAWLLVEAAEAYGDETIIERSKPTSVAIARACAKGLDPETFGMYAEEEDGRLLKRMDWWVQAEAVVGFFNAYALTGEAHFLNLTERVLDYIDRYVVDREGGVFREWLSDASLPASDPRNAYPVNGWKTPYHNGRMYMELMERIDRMMKEEE